MKLSYELSSLAIKDLDDIWTYSAEHWSIKTANEYFNSIFDIIDLICLYPESGKQLREVNDKHRFQLVKSHMIIYQISQHKILIDRILHQRMDYDSKLR